MQQGTLSLGAIARIGALAGLAGAVLIDAYLIVTVVLIGHATSIAGFYQFVASGALGPSAYASPPALYLGVAVHVLVGLAWATGYAYVAARTPQVRTQPLISGIAFGVVVMTAMQLVEVAANIYTLPHLWPFVNGFIAHVVFFGLPIAYIVSNRLERTV